GGGVSAGQPIETFAFRFFTLDLREPMVMPAKGSYSSAPMSVAAPITRGPPSKSNGPLAGVSPPALFLGERAASRRPPAEALTKSGGWPWTAVVLIAAPLPLGVP